MLPAGDGRNLYSRHDPLKVLPSNEDREDARETRAGAGQTTAPPRAPEADTTADTPEARLPQAAAQPDGLRPDGFSTLVSAERWSIAAGACLLVAAACLVLGRMDAAFVAGTLGIVAWFWNERNRLQPRGIEADERFRDEDEEFEDRDEK